VIANNAQALRDAQNNTKEAYLTDAGDREYMVTSALNLLMTGLIPNKVLQRVKRYLRHEARKPFDYRLYYGRQTDPQRHPDVLNQHAERRRAI